MSDTADRVKKIVVEHLGVEADKVTEEASFIDDLGADSLDIVELVMAFEEEFGVEIPDDAAEKISTVSGRDQVHRRKQGLIAHIPFCPEHVEGLPRPDGPGRGGLRQAQPSLRGWACLLIFRRIQCVVSS